MSLRFGLDDLPPALRAQAEAQLGRKAPAVAPVRHSGTKRVSRQGSGEERPPCAVRKLNKTEARFLAEWPPGRRNGLILAQALIFPFPDGTSYRPDFLSITEGQITAYEIKGGHVGKVAWSRHGIERFRRAADVFGGWVQFELWTLKGGAWERTHVRAN